MTTPTVVVGLNCSHDAAAAVAIDGVLVAAISEERLTKSKHHEGLPARAIDYCLEEAGLDRQSLTISSLVINQLPSMNFDLLALEFFGKDRVERLSVNPSHHYLHACYAEMMTEDRPLIILVVDGSGYTYAEHKRQGSPLLGPEPSHADMWESLTAYYVAEDGSTSLLLKDWGCWRDTTSFRFPSLGHMYGHAALRVFGSWTQAGKLMGLAPFGDPAALGDKPIVTLTHDGVEVDTDWLLGIPRIRHRDHLETVPLARNIAAKAQAELEKGMMHLCSLLADKTNCQTICLTGGVALNSAFNGRLVREGPFERVVVSPASSDAGTAIGAAAYGYKDLRGRRLRVGKDIEFLGRVYTDDEIVTALKTVAADVCVSTCDQPLRLAVEDLERGKIVGWFEGASEFGPRALGHRSILADPRRADIKDRLNSRVKFRESFRPYAAAVLEECCAAWFEQRVESPHMLMVADVRPEARALIPAVVHVDGTCRLQTVGTEYAGSLRALIEAFFSKTGVPLVLNTSLNIHGQPMAETPADAVSCLMNSGLDVLYCGNYRVKKKETANLTEREMWQSRPVPATDYSLVARCNAGGGGEPRQWSIWQGNRQLPITVEEKDVLLNLSGDKTVLDIAKAIPGADVNDVLACVQSLCDRGLLRVEHQPEQAARPEYVEA